MTAKSKQDLATRCIHAGDTVDPATGAVMPPIYTSSTFEQESFGQPGEHVYGRASNPTRDALERCVADLEGGARGLAFSAGQAATAAVLELLDAGAHVVAPADLYGGTLRLFKELRTKSSGLQFSFVDFTDIGQIEQAVRPDTRLIWVETPTNPLLRILDLNAVVDIARKNDLLVAVDNTFATPCVQRPIELGCDIVMHSATKYLGGHSDTLGGLLVLSDADRGKRLASLRSAVGSVMGPFTAYLVLRGVKTLALRMERHQANALEIAKRLQSSDALSQVIYPGLVSHPQHGLAKQQMDGFGAVVTIELKGGHDAVASFMNRIEVFTLAESLGGVESLAGHPATMSHSNQTAEARASMGITDSMVRLSVGIESVEDLIADLEQALDS